MRVLLSPDLADLLQLLELEKYKENFEKQEVCVGDGGGVCMGWWRCVGDGGGVCRDGVGDGVGDGGVCRGWWRCVGMEVCRGWWRCV